MSCRRCCSGNCASIIVKGSNRRLEFELGAWLEGACGFALVLALSQMREHGLGPFGRADLHPRPNPLDRQGRFAPQPGNDGRLAGVAAPSSGQLGLLPAPARKLLRDDAVGPLKTGKWREVPFSCLQSSWRSSAFRSLEYDRSPSRSGATQAPKTCLGWDCATVVQGKPRRSPRLLAFDQ